MIVVTKTYLKEKKEGSVIQITLLEEERKIYFVTLLKICIEKIVK